MKDPIPFVDAHVHLWKLDGSIGYSWLRPPFSDDGPNGSVEAIAVDYELDDYLADAKRWNVVGMVHVEAGADASQALDETDWVQTIADRRGLPNGVVAFAALDHPNIERSLEAHAGHAAVRGVRQIVNWHANPQRTYSATDVTLNPTWERGFSLLGQRGLSFDLQCYPKQMPNIAAIAQRHPEVPIIVNHAGMPVIDDPNGLDEWRRGMALLAALPQVSVKLSGFGFIDRGWAVQSVHHFVRELIDLFGPDRLMAASDFPTDKLFADFDKCLEALHALTADLSKDERSAIFARNAMRTYRLNISGPNA
ncbi:amidohydrolase family protein [Sphingobium tyrosinilyticum]|uniref:Amidohydrolase family protein n=1 Tax=Sphingobium tyrosinilyticum TaxID=2715436 RepID=A0ABV9EY17_9SPHN